ncbi:DUF1963 domain-containing protein [Flagellimonas crocea]|uniref:DUF1963 domain-containing protein n=1 Tax=Flagellimonas crocea TaxID=3067311 RepID=UPI00296F6AD0|nr:DUF1963 domain-containing protein [Muricauda sp. DH64]
MNNHKRALEIIHDFLKERNLENDFEELKDNVHYFLDYKETKIEDEWSVPLGTSKVGGLPHLPDSIKLLPNELFLAQLNCAELKDYDIFNLFPDSGIIYFFIKNGDFPRYAYYDGEASQLKVCQYPEQDESLYGKKELMERSCTIDFVNTELITIVKSGLEWRLGDSFNELDSLLKENLNCPVTFYHYGGYSSLPTDFIFGRPIYWQGEDEEFRVFEEGEDEEESYSYRFSDSHIFSMEYGEGNINFFTKSSALDVSRDLDEQIIETYSGT